MKKCCTKPVFYSGTPGGRYKFLTLKGFTKMVEITFNAEKREKAGKGAARACRREGRIPAVIYGGKQEPVMVSLHPVELEKALDTFGFYKADITVAVDGKKYSVICQDVQFHPVTDRPIHVDFLRK